LADATRASALVLAAAFDRVFIETVGVGQSESDVASVADTLLYVAQPGAGDMLQFMKAGILELPDVFAVNKADLGAVAGRTASELSAGLGLSSRENGGWTPPVLQISARDAHGIEPLLDALDAHRRFLEKDGRLESRRRRASEEWALEALELRYGSFGLDAVGGRDRVASRLHEETRESAIGAVRSFGLQIEEALRKS
jgi:LAO/AO transport system kinase